MNVTANSLSDIFGESDDAATDAARRMNWTNTRAPRNQPKIGNPGYARTRRDQQVEIVRFQTGDISRRVQTQNAEQAGNHGGGQRRARNSREGATQLPNRRYQQQRHPNHT